MSWWRRLRRAWHRDGEAAEIRAEAEEQLRAARRQRPQVRREAARPLPQDEFVDRVARAFRLGPQ